jgi:hypothetical protein
MKISVKSALIFLASGLIPLATIALIGYDQLRDLALDKAHGQVRQEALRMADSVNAWMNENRRMMSVLARNQRVVEAAQGGKASATPIPGTRWSSCRTPPGSRSRAATASDWSRWGTSLPPNAC